MMRYGFYIAALLAVSNAAVLELTGDSFDKEIDARPNVLVKFYAPWCRACKRVKPEYDRADEILKGLDVDISLAQVDVEVEQNRHLVERYSVKRFPTFMLFRDGIIESLESFWSASAESIVASTQEALKLTPIPPIKELTTSSDAASWLFWRGTDGGFLESAAVLFVPEGATEDDAQAVTTVFEESAMKMVGELRFAVIRSASVIEDFNMDKTKAQIALYKEFDEGKDIYDGAIDIDALINYLRRRNVPLVTIADDFNINALQTAGNVLVHVFEGEAAANGSVRTGMMEDISTAALALEQRGLSQRGDVTFALTNGEKNKAWVKWFKLPEGVFPSVGIFNPADDSFYAMSVKDLPTDAVSGNNDSTLTVLVRYAMDQFYAGELTAMKAA